MAVLTIEVFAPDTLSFACGGDFEASLGLVTRLLFSVEKDRPLRCTILRHL
jgi:hypothetical protein